MGKKQGAGRANLRKKEKPNGLVGVKNRGRANLRKKDKPNLLVWAKNRGWGGPILGKREDKWISRG